MYSQSTVVKAVGVLAAISVLVSGSTSQAAAASHVEEQKPMADPDPEAFDDSIWTASPLYERALSLMKESPLIDTHIDLPQVIRSLGALVHGKAMMLHAS